MDKIDVLTKPLDTSLKANSDVLEKIHKLTGRLKEKILEENKEFTIKFTCFCLEDLGAKIEYSADKIYQPEEVELILTNEINKFILEEYNSIPATTNNSCTIGQVAYCINTSEITQHSNFSIFNGQKVLLIDSQEIEKSLHFLINLNHPCIIECFGYVAWNTSHKVVVPWYPSDLSLYFSETTSLLDKCVLMQQFTSLIWYLSIKKISVPKFDFSRVLCENTGNHVKIKIVDFSGFDICTSLTQTEKLIDIFDAIFNHPNTLNDLTEPNTLKIQSYITDSNLFSFNYKKIHSDLCELIASLT